MKKNSFKITPIRAAVIGATLLAVNGVAVAAPVSTTLEFVCPFPLIGNQNIIAQISADIPEVVDVSKTNEVGPIHITTVNIIPDKARVGLGLVDATKITGTATAINNIHAISEDRPLVAVLDIEPTDVPTVAGPFNVLANGNAPVVTVDESHIGPVSITVDDLILNLVNLKSNGQVAPAPIGEFEADCSLVEGQDNTLVTLEVISDDIIVVPDPADIHVDVQTVDFGTVKMGDPAVTQTITITNEGDLDLTIYSASLSGAGAASFIENNSCTTVTKGSSCTIEVTYLASEAGTQNAILSIASNDTDESMIAVSLTGTADLEVPQNIEVNPSSIDFGTITLPSTPKTETITISNTGGEALTVSEVTVTGSYFIAGSDNCTGAIISPESSCTTNITFTPVEGTSEGTVTISSDDEDDSTIVIPLTGTGKDDTLPPIIFDVDYTLAGETYIAASRATVPLSGDISASLDAISGNLTGNMTLNPTSGKFEIIQGWKKYLATAKIEFETVKDVEGTLIDGKLVATSSAYIKLPKVTKTLFGWINWKIGGGKNCRTSEPVTFNIRTIDGEKFEPLIGGNVVGTYTLPKLENCGPLTGILNLKMAGPGNTINLNLAPNFK